MYGGYLKPGTGELVAIQKDVVFDGSDDENWGYYSISSGTHNLFRISVSDRANESIVANQPNIAKYVCNAYSPATNLTTGRTNGTFSGTGTNVDFVNDSYSNVTSWKAYLAQNPIQFVYHLATPITYQLTPEEMFTLLKGVNNVWNTTGNTEITYKADTRLFIENAIAEAVAAL